jgi:hypothetical protein
MPASHHAKPIIRPPKTNQIILPISAKVFSKLSYGWFVLLCFYCNCNWISTKNTPIICNIVLRFRFGCFQRRLCPQNTRSHYGQRR